MCARVSFVFGWLVDKFLVGETALARAFSRRRSWRTST